jgi:hypothetical protein
MSEKNDEAPKPPDPFDPFRGLRDAYLDALSKTMINAVNTEGYAKATGAMLDYYLAASGPFREAAEKATLLGLRQLSLPSRQEIAALAERFTNLEMRLDDLDAKIDRILNAVDRLKQTEPAVKEPKRSRPTLKRK